MVCSVTNKCRISIMEYSIEGYFKEENFHK